MKLERHFCIYLFLENTGLKGEAAAILSCVMKTLYLLWQYVKNIENDYINIVSITNI